jgi:hypothetical protein
MAAVVPPIAPKLHPLQQWTLDKEKRNLCFMVNTAAMLVALAMEVLMPSGGSIWQWRASMISSVVGFVGLCLITHDEYRAQQNRPAGTPMVAAAVAVVETKKAD